MAKSAGAAGTQQPRAAERVQQQPSEQQQPEQQQQPPSSQQQHHAEEQQPEDHQHPTNNNNSNQQKKQQKAKHKKLLSAERLARAREAADRRGIVYLSRLPPHLKPAKLRQLLSAHGEVGRIYCTPEDASGRRKRGSGSGRSFTEGWVEFEDKRDAKLAAAALNSQPMGGRRRSAHHFDLWNIKYLPKFKWDHLTEEVAYERAVRQQRLATELAAAKRERDFYLSRVDAAKAQAAMAARRAARGGSAGGAGGGAEQQQQQQPPVAAPAAAAAAAAAAGGGDAAAAGAVGAKRAYGQRKAKPGPAQPGSGSGGIGADVLSLLVATRKKPKL